MFVALALVNLATVLAGVALTARVAGQFRTSADHVERWGVRIAQLGTLSNAVGEIAAVTAPGGGGEAGALVSAAGALARFQTERRLLLEDLVSEPEPAANEIAQRLERMDRVVSGMSERTAALTEASARGELAEAMDLAASNARVGMEVADELSRLVLLASAEQLKEFRTRGEVAGTLAGREAWIASALVLLVLGVTVHGLRLASARQLADDRNERLINELEESRERADSANQSKSHFLANMSHEIRTPMTAILGYADVLMTAGLAESERVQCVQTIRRNGDHLLSLINDILDLSKIEAGRMTVETIPCEVHGLVSDVASLMRPRAEDKGLGLEVEFVGPIPETIRTDPTRLRQILINLLSNAVKFTDSGGARLVVRAASRGQGGASLLQFEVIDSGVGMSEEQLNRLFHPFVQADSSTTRRFGGTGLGLTITKSLAEKLGGEISATSRPGEGSAFVVSVATGPLEGVRMLSGLREAGAEEARARGLAGERAVLEGLRVLLAEDGPDNQRLLRFILARAGADVEVVENGRLAVDRAASEWEADRPFDVIVMDMQMPLLDGYAAASELRCRGYSGPIIALTAHAMAGDREKCLAAGCDDYATKPIDRVKLIAACAEAAGRSVRAS